ncbi:hypothetical protein ACNKHS_00010 [Shigella flexneri]
MLGRNGSDYSAAVLAACLRADCCEIWTDVDGVYPAIRAGAQTPRLLKSMSYQEAMELSYLALKCFTRVPSSPIPVPDPFLIKNPVIRRRRYADWRQRGMK